MQGVLGKLTYANVAATLALFIALGGSAAAASGLITSAEIKDGSVRGSDLANHTIGAQKLKRNSVGGGYIRNHSVTGTDIRNGSLQLTNLSAAALKQLEGGTGAPGAPGPTGPQGPAGPQGAAGPAGTSIKLAGYIKADPQTLPDDSSFHPAWSLHFTVNANQLFILTGNIGGASTPGCPGGDGTYSQRITLDSSTLWGQDSDGTTTGTQPNGILTFTAGTHTLSWDFRGDCTGYPVNVSSQQVILIPFTLP